MKNITVVTTFHQEGLELYGQRFLDSFTKHVDPKIKLIVYAENCNPVVNDSRITVLNSATVLPKLTKFKETWGNDPKANGKCPFPERRPRDWHKEFKWDAIRFSNKVYAVFDACTRSIDWCVWMDADTYVHSDWSYEDFSNLLEDDKWITYVGRGKGSQTWPECGFYGLNLNNETCLLFLEKFEEYYENAQTGIFSLDEWHDSYVFGTILKEFENTDDNTLDYSANIYNRTAKTGGGGHPLINTELGKWIDHLKGDRKHTKRSKPKDLLSNRPESYWNEV